MTTAFAAKLHLPAQDLAAPQQFAANRNALQAWLDALPKTNLGQSTRALYTAIMELNRVSLAPMLRLQLLETLRPAIHFATTGLRRHYLNRPIQLPEQAHKVAQLAHVLNEQMALGYALAAVHSLAPAKDGLSRAQRDVAVATALHRAVAEHSQNLLRDLLLCRNPHPGCWHALHQLALLARECGVADSPVGDSLYGDSSVQNAYVRALLVGGARPNQLRQEHLDIVFSRALDWAAAATLGAADVGIMVVNHNSDEGPVYREFAADRGGPACWGLDTAYLAREIDALRLQAEAAGGNVQLTDTQMTPELLAHLVQTWSSAGVREFVRTAVHEQVEISAGLTATHHFLADGIDFHLLLGDSHHAVLAKDENPFMRPKGGSATPSSRDVWDSAYQTRPGVKKVSLEVVEYAIRGQQQRHTNERERDKFRSETAERINVSPGGLCISWPMQSTVMLRTGEIVGIRESADGNWSVGVVRWGRLTDAGARLGIQLLSPNAAPYGARVISKAGPQGDYQRVLVLPEIRQIGQPTTLIAPRLPFRVGQKVSLMCRNKETRVQLTRKLGGAAAFNQFEFRRLGTLTEKQPATDVNNGSSGFDSLWDSL